MRKLPLVLLSLLLASPAFNQTQHGVFLTWTAPVVDATHSAATGYNVYRSTGSGPIKLNTTPVTGTSFVDPTSNLTVSTTYTYDVTAVNAAGDESLASNSAVVTTGAALPSNPGAPTGCNAKLQ